MDANIYCHASTGIVNYDPGIGTRHFEPWIAMLLCDTSIIEYFAWLMTRAGVGLNKGFRWGAHITFVRREEPPNQALWGKHVDEEVPFDYGHEIHWTNGWHAWVDVWCPRLTEIRQELGLVTHPQAKYHLALGRLVEPCEDVKVDHNDPRVL